MERLPAVVLAAGASRRMGRPKPLLPVGGRPCLERVLDAFRAAGHGPVVLVLGCRHREILAGIRPGPGVVPVIHRGWESGQTGSVKAGLRAVAPSAPAVFVMPGDHPLLEAESIRALAARLEEGPAGRSIFIPTWRGRRGHPLLLGGGHRLAILGMGDGDPLHAHLRMRSGEVEHVEAGPGVVRGMNTEREYRGVLEAAARQAGPVTGERA